jgi:hypothetical protein
VTSLGLSLHENVNAINSKKISIETFGFNLLME